MIKSILGGKSKNLFDVSKADVVIHSDMSFSSNVSYISHFYSIPVEAGQTYTVSYDASGVAGGGVQILLSCQTGDFYQDGVLLFMQLTPSNAINNWRHLTHTFTIPSGATKITFSSLKYPDYPKYFRNFQIELGSTATEYVPYELTSYKSIMKVSDVCQLVDKSKFTASITRNGITCVSNGDGSITLNGTCTDGFALNPFNQQIPVDQTHFYYTSPYLSINYSARINGTFETGGIRHIKTSAQPTKFNTVFYIWIDKDKSFSNVTTYVNIDDLTEMFGAGNEPKTIAEFKAKFPNDYYPYSPSCFVTSFDERMVCKTKNLFSPSTEVGTLEGGFGGPSVERTFEENKWYQGFTTNGYYSPGNVRDFDIHPNSLYIYSSGAGYGMSRAIKCEPNTNYFIFCSYSHISGGEGNVYVGYFDEGGNFISNLNMDMKYKFVITTPSNCKWLIINFTTRGVGKVYFSDIQLVKGSTATDYVPYGYV